MSFYKRMNAFAFGAVSVVAMLSATPASAASFVFDFTGGTRAETPGSLTYTATSGSTTVRVTATAYHFNENSAMTQGTVAAATLGNYVPDGLGVRFGSDPSDVSGGSDSTGTHQIDNVGGGVDFIALQFDQAVQLTAFGRTVFSASAVNDSDASVYGYNSAAAYGALNLTGQTFDYSLFTQILGGQGSSGGSNNTGSVSSGFSNVYLIAADVGSGDRDDGFKIRNATVNFTPSVTPPTSAVPEPATWAMMIFGFGAVGGTLRRQRNQAARTVAA